MKKLTFTIIAAFVFINVSFAQWTTSSPNIYYNTGSVSIGTTTFPNLFTVQGTGTSNTYQARVTDGTRVLNLGAYSAAAQIQSSGGPLYINNGGNNTILNGSAGNVGIGTTSPTVPLTVQGTGTLGSGYQYKIIDVTSTKALFFGANATATEIQSTSGTPLYINYNGSSTILNGNGTGSVGIGTATPSALFTVFGTGTLGSVYQTKIIDLASGTKSLMLGANSTAGEIQTAGGVPLYLNNGGNNIFLATASTGNVGIATTNTHGYKLAVNGTVIATSVTVEAYANWADYVFKKGYRLPPLTAVKTYINQNQHLPGIPSATQIAKDGINLGEMNTLLIKKVEELTLYIIDKDEQLKQEKLKNQEQDNRIKKLEQEMQLLLNKGK